MTEPTPGKVAQLTPEEWKQLVLLNNAQLQNFLQSIPGNGETGVSGLTAEHLALIDQHIARGRTFLRAWAVAKLDIAPVKVATPQPSVPNGAGKKGGWPKGKKRTRAPNPAPTADQ